MTVCAPPWQTPAMTQLDGVPKIRPTRHRDLSAV